MNKEKKEKMYIFLLVCIVLIQAIYITIIFGVHKVGYHSDELSHYTFANNYSVGMEKLNNEQFVMGEWVDSYSLWNRITVEPEHRFSYASVNRNTSADVNPPLHYYILHTICSFFPNTFSKWYCFAINIICFVIGQVYLYLLTDKLVRGSKLASFSSVILYGFGVGCFNTTSYLRMYSMATCLAIVFSYYSFILFENRRNVNKKKMLFLFIAIFLSCFFGSYSLHLFLVYAFGITICYTIYYLFSRNWKLFIWHGICCAASVGISFLLVPSTSTHAFQSAEVYTYAQQMYPQKWQYRLLWYIMTKDLFGLHTNAWPKPIFSYVLLVIVIALFILVPFCFIFRREKWFKTSVKKIFTYSKEIFKQIKNFQFGLIPLGFATLFLLLIISYRASVYTMQWYIDRYMFICYPAFVVFVICVVYYVVNLLSKNKMTANIIVLILSIIFAVWSNVVSNHVYYFNYPQEGFTFDDLEEDSNIILLLSAKWQLNSFTIELWDTGKYYATDFRTFMDDEYKLNKLDDGPLYLLVDQNYVLEDDEEIPEWKENSIMKHEYEILDFYKSLDGVDNITYLGTDGIFGKDIKIYRIDM